MCGRTWTGVAINGRMELEDQRKAKLLSYLYCCVFYQLVSELVIEHRGIVVKRGKVFPCFYDLFLIMFLP